MIDLDRSIGGRERPISLQVGPGTLRPGLVPQDIAGLRQLYIFVLPSRPHERVGRGRCGPRDTLNEFIRWCMDGVTFVAVRIASVAVPISAVQSGLQTPTSDLDPRTSRWASDDATGVTARGDVCARTATSS